MDVIQPDTASCGGHTEAKRIADMAWTHGVRYNPHVWGTGIGLAAAMQLLAVLPTGAPSLGAHQPLLEYDSTPHPFRQGLLAEPIRVAHRSEEHTSELQSLMRHSYAVFCLTQKNKHTQHEATNS